MGSGGLKRAAPESYNLTVNLAAGGKAMQADDFGMFDSVKLKTSIYCEDIDGELVSFRKGKAGSVLELGKGPNTVIVEFKIGRGMKGTDYTAVELEADCLEMVTKIGRRFPSRTPTWRRPWRLKPAL